MKSIIKNTGQYHHANHKYPCLQIGTGGMIVLFSEAGRGTLVDPGVGFYDIGSVGEWNEELFAPFSGTIELSN